MSVLLVGGGVVALGILVMLVLAQAQQIEDLQTAYDVMRRSQEHWRNRAQALEDPTTEWLREFRQGVNARVSRVMKH